MTMRYLLASVVLALIAGAAVAQTTHDEQTALTPDKVLADLMEGNSRYVAGKASDPDIKERIAKSADHQYPKAIILSCIDSRVPVELVFDQRLGDIFVGRVAGNVEDEDQLGSMEYSTKVAGAKLVFVLGHGSCGAVKGACDGVELGNLTGLLAKIKPAVDAVEGFKPEDRTSKNHDFVDKVAEENVRDTLANIRKESPVLMELETAGQIKIVGGFYDLHSGKVTLLK